MVDVEVAAVLEIAPDAGAAAAAVEVGIGGDPVAGAEALHAVAGVDDLSADVDAQDRWQLDVVGGVRVAPAHPDVAMVDRGRAQPHE